MLLQPGVAVRDSMLPCVRCLCLSLQRAIPSRGNSQLTRSRQRVIVVAHLTPSAVAGPLSWVDWLRNAVLAHFNIVLVLFQCLRS